MLTKLELGKADLKPKAGKMHRLSGYGEIAEQVRVEVYLRALRRAIRSPAVVMAIATRATGD